MSLGKDTAETPLGMPLPSPPVGVGPAEVRLMTERKFRMYQVLTWFWYFVMAIVFAPLVAAFYKRKRPKP